MIRQHSMYVLFLNYLHFRRLYFHYNFFFVVTRPKNLLSIYVQKKISLFCRAFALFLSFFSWPSIKICDEKIPFCQIKFIKHYQPMSDRLRNHFQSLLPFIVYEHSTFLNVVSRKNCLVAVCKKKKKNASRGKNKSSCTFNIESFKTR